MSASLASVGRIRGIGETLRRRVRRGRLVYGDPGPARREYRGVARRRRERRGKRRRATGSAGGTGVSAWSTSRTCASTSRTPDRLAFATLSLHARLVARTRVRHGRGRLAGVAGDSLRGGGDCGARRVRGVAQRGGGGGGGGGGSGLRVRRERLFLFARLGDGADDGVHGGAGVRRERVDVPLRSPDATCAEDTTAGRVPTNAATEPRVAAKADDAAVFASAAPAFATDSASPWSASAGAARAVAMTSASLAALETFSATSLASPSASEALRLSAANPAAAADASRVTASIAAGRAGGASAFRRRRAAAAAAAEDFWTRAVISAASSASAARSESCAAFAASRAEAEAPSASAAAEAETREASAHALRRPDTRAEAAAANAASISRRRGALRVEGRGRVVHGRVHISDAGGHSLLVLGSQRAGAPRRRPASSSAAADRVDRLFADGEGGEHGVRRLRRPSPRVLQSRLRRRLAAAESFVESLSRRFAASSASATADHGTSGTRTPRRRPRRRRRARRRSSAPAGRSLCVARAAEARAAACAAVSSAAVSSTRGEARDARGSGGTKRACAFFASPRSAAVLRRARSCAASPIGAASSSAASSAVASAVSASSVLTLARRAGPRASRSPRSFGEPLERLPVLPRGSRARLSRQPPPRGWSDCAAHERGVLGVRERGGGFLRLRLGGSACAFPSPPSPAASARSAGAAGAVAARGRRPPGCPSTLSLSMDCSRWACARNSGRSARTAACERLVDAETLDGETVAITHVLHRLAQRLL